MFKAAGGNTDISFNIVSETFQFQEDVAPKELKKSVTLHSLPFFPSVHTDGLSRTLGVMFTLAADTLKLKHYRKDPRGPGTRTEKSRSVPCL